MGKMATRLSRIFDNAVRAKVVSLEAMTKAKQQAAQNLETMPSVESVPPARLHDLMANFA